MNVKIYYRTTIYRNTKINQAKSRVQALALADISRSALCCHSNETCATIANLPSSAQLEGTAYHSPSYIRVHAWHAVVWECDQYTFRLGYASCDM